MGITRLFVFRLRHRNAPVSNFVGGVWKEQISIGKTDVETPVTYFTSIEPQLTISMSKPLEFTGVAVSRLRGTRFIVSHVGELW